MAMATSQSEGAIIDEEDATFAGALPKQEIQATQFLIDHPSFDGRGTVIAIFDTGVDPGASGLQLTSDGKAKIIDVVDCTGSGDVDTTTVVAADADGVLPALHGARLRVNPSWANPTGEWRVGARAAFDLFPAPLKARLREERRRRWDEAQRVAVTRAVADLGAAPPAADAAAAKAREELEARVKLLAELAAKYEDLGEPVDLRSASPRKSVCCLPDRSSQPPAPSLPRAAQGPRCTAWCGTTAPNLWPPWTRQTCLNLAPAGGRWPISSLSPTTATAAATALFPRRTPATLPSTSTTTARRCRSWSTRAAMARTSPASPPLSTLKTRR
jgi:tripeptidyl-peptidase-2